MQKRIYVGGLPWEFDRISLVNYFKAILDCNDIQASYELPFINPPLLNANAVMKVTDVFVAIDKVSRKSRGFGFITLEFIDDKDEKTSDDNTALFQKVIDLLNDNVVLGIRGPRTLIVNEADPRQETSVNTPDEDQSTKEDTFI